FLPGDHELYVFWHVDDDSWFHDVVVGRGRWVVIRYELVKIGHRNKDTQVFQTLRVTARFPDPTWSEARPSNNKVEGLFAGPAPSDASEPFADAELAGAPIATPTKEEVKNKNLGCE